jgi:hypothetical protein
MKSPPQWTRDSNDQKRPSPDEVWRIFLSMAGGEGEANPRKVYERFLVIRELEHLVIKWDGAAADDWATKREALQEILDLLSDDVGERSQPALRMLRELREAVTFAQDGRKHPLFDVAGPSSLEQLRSQGRVEAIAAALLEWGVEEKFANQQELAGKIAEALERAGYCRRRWGREPKRRYSRSAIIKWRDKHRKRDEPGQDYFELWVAKLREGWVEIREDGPRHGMPDVGEQVALLEEIARGWSRPAEPEND